jgi:hypothetical protein
MEEAKKEFIEPELVKHEEKLADVTAGRPGYTSDSAPEPV